MDSQKSRGYLLWILDIFVTWTVVAFVAFFVSEDLVIQKISFICVMLGVLGTLTSLSTLAVVFFKQWVQCQIDSPQNCEKEDDPVHIGYMD